MSISRIDNDESVVTIKCDKCGNISTSTKSLYNKQFYEEGWVLRPRAKKYKHLCYDCLPKKDKRTHAFVKNIFYVG